MQLFSRTSAILMILFVCMCGNLDAQKTRNRITANGCDAATEINGVYRIDIERSDRLYSVIEEAASNVPFSEQQQFFMDLAVRLTPPDLLAIECRGKKVSLASSRSPRIDFVADGAARNVKNSDGRSARSRIAFERNSLIFASTGGDDDLNFTFTPFEGGKSLRVTRRLSSRELVEPVIIRTVYNKINSVAAWDVFDNSPTERKTNEPETNSGAQGRSVKDENRKAVDLRDALDEWIAATNNRDIEKQMSFYMPELKAFYLARNASRSSVRREKTGAFASAKTIDIRAAEPEIIFQDGGQTAIMRFRKKYRIENGAKTRAGEVVQELRWQQTASGWKIFSERDIRVIS